MIKRIIKITIFVICLTLIVPGALSIPAFAIYGVIRYIITGNGDVDVCFLGMDFTMKLPFNISDKLNL